MHSEKAEEIVKEMDTQDLKSCSLNSCTGDEISGEGNTLGFDERMFDTRLCRWFSQDPLKTHSPSLSPYVGMANSPMIIVDSDGRENIVYIVLSKTASAKLTPADKAGILQEAQKNINSVMGDGVVEVKYFQYGEDNFNIEYLDPTDAVAYLGNLDEVKKFAVKQKGEGTTMDTFTGARDGNPEHTSGDLIGVDINVDYRYGFTNSINQDLKANTVEVLGFAIAHGCGHTGGHNTPKHSNDAAEDYKLKPNSKAKDQSLMTDGKPVKNGITGGKQLSDYGRSPYNKELKASFSQKFTAGGKPKDNYAFNMAFHVIAKLPFVGSAKFTPTVSHNVRGL